MLRSLLGLLLLANYLLVIGAGLLVERPEPAFSAAKPYVHSTHCQEQNYLRLDCFEQCNGHQQEAKAKLPTGEGLHFLAQLKGLDVHCHAELGTSFQKPALRVAPEQTASAPSAAIAAAFGNRDYPPPRRG